MSGVDAFVYLFEEDAIRMVHRDWPEGMNLAFCLEDSGDCEMVVYHKEEGRNVLRKVSAVLRRGPGQFAVTPEAPGYPTRKILFSEEQMMLAMLGDADQLIEVAHDYAINYRFARDEGLDPETLTAPAAPREAAPIRPQADAPREPSRLHLGEAAERPARPAPQPVPEAPARRLFQRRDPVPPQPPERPVDKTAEPAAGTRKKAVFLPAGYSPADAPERRECQFTTARIAGQGGRIRITLGEGKVTINTKTVHVADVGFRDDFSRFVLPRFTLAEWKADKVMVLDIPQEMFPAALAARFRTRPCRGEVTITAQGIFVAPGEALEEEEARPRRRFLTPARAAVLALLCVGLATGTMVKAFQIQVDGSRPGLVAEAGTQATTLARLKASLAP